MNIQELIAAQYTQEQEVTEEKVASAEDLEAFQKFASDNGIDLSTLDDAQTSELVDFYVGKLAEESEQEEESDEEKAKKEFAAKKEEEKKTAEAMHLGAVMARAFEEEREKIAAQKTASARGATKTAGALINVAEPSALDKVAGARAVKIAHEFGYNADQCADRIAALLTLGAPESKVASKAESAEQAAQYRAMELLAMAGYPVEG